MLLKSLEISGYSSFYESATLIIDDRVTILTGQNDVGKTAILRLLNLLYRGEQGQEFDANYDRMYHANDSWDKDKGVSCVATFILTAYSHLYLPAATNNQLPIGTEVDVQFFVTVNRRVDAVYRLPNNQEYRPNSRGIHRLPKIIWISDEEEISSEFSIENANSLEKSLLKLAFGENDVKKLANLPTPALARQLRSANDRINNHLRRFFPHSLGLELVLAQVSDTTSFRFTIGFRDKFQGDTPIERRGRGIRKIVSLMISLMLINLEEEHVVILMDEPENSLHSDAQHLLRRVLEEIANNEAIQVIYATHSPSMINSVDPRGLRLLERTMTKDSKATTIINNRPYLENYLPVRSSLGLVPSDSLLYSAITIIVEGDTEVLCVPYLIKRFYNESISGFEDAENLLNFSHLVNGMGDSFDKWCHLAISQGSKPIIFVDGDKVKRLRQSPVKAKLKGVPIVALNDGNEIEDLIPHSVYFTALAQFYKKDEISETAFNAWQKNAKLPKQMMFSKQVDRWLQDTYGFCLEKPSTMRHAFEYAQTEDINIAPIKELIETIAEIIKT